MLLPDNRDHESKISTKSVDDFSIYAIFWIAGITIILYLNHRKNIKIN